MRVFFEKVMTDQAFLVQTVIIGLLFLLLLIAFLLLIKLNKRLKVATHNQDGMNIETIINQYYVDIDETKATQNNILTKQQEITKFLEKCLTKVGVVRFNPFHEVGGDQSFVIALLDQKNNGIVISSLYNRTNCRFYGKPIIAGKSEYSLSDEEIEAISRAQGERKEKK